MSRHLVRDGRVATPPLHYGAGPRECPVRIIWKRPVVRATFTEANPDPDSPPTPPERQTFVVPFVSDHCGVPPRAALPPSCPPRAFGASWLRLCRSPPRSAAAPTMEPTKPPKPLTTSMGLGLPRSAAPAD